MHRAKLTAILVAITMSFSVSQAFTEVSGNVGTTTWTKANSPYHVTASIDLATSDTLTIEPGVDVLIAPYATLYYNGHLKALGTEQDSIRFLPLQPGQMWSKIWLIAVGDSLRYVRISGGGVDRNEAVGISGLTGSYQSFYFSHVVITGNRSGIYAIRSESLDIVLDYCAFDGGFIDDAADSTHTITITNCTMPTARIEGVYDPTYGGDTTYATIKNSVLYSGGITTAGSPFLTKFDEVSYCNTIQGDTLFPGVGNINANPMFVNKASGDFRLRRDSPAINTADPSSPLDPDGSRADMGAHPFEELTPVFDEVATTLGDGVLGAAYIDTLYANDGNADSLVYEVVESSMSGWVIDGQNLTIPYPGVGLDDGGPQSVAVRAYDQTGRADTLALNLVFNDMPLAADNVAPVVTALSGNSPNPFNPSTTISYSTVSSERVSLAIYDMLGQHVCTLASGVMPVGYHTAVWNGSDDIGREVSSGVYLIRFTAGDVTQVRRMVLVR